MHSMLRGTLASALLAAVLLVPLELVAQAERPRLAILDLAAATGLNNRETQVAAQVDVVQKLREGLIDSGSFLVVARDDRNLQAIARERVIANADSDPAAQVRLGLDTADYYLEPVWSRFDLATSYTEVPLLEGSYDRSDSADLELTARVFDDAGNILFEERVSRIVRYPNIEADEAARTRNAARAIGPIADAAAGLVDDVITAMISRINPIVVLDAQAASFVIDRGKNNGFDKDTRFSVFAQARTVVHPTTGEPRTIPGSRIGEAQVVEIYEEVAELKLVTGDNSAVPVGAIVRIIEE